MAKSSEVEAWFAGYENPMKPVVQRIRAIVLGADKRLEECIKWQAPTFMYLGNLASFFPKSKQHASLMFHLGAKIPGKHPRLEGTGGTSRVMKIKNLAEAEAAKGDLERVVRAWCDWRAADGGGKSKASKTKKATSTVTKPTAKKSSAQAAGKPAAGRQKKKRRA